MSRVAPLSASCLALSIGVGAALFACSCGPASPGDRDVSAERPHLLRGIYGAFSLYASDNGGRIPYDPRGPDYALYQLKAYVERVTLYSCPEPGAEFRWAHGHVGLFSGAGCRQQGEAQWDDAVGRLVGGQVDYLNMPRALDRRSPAFVLYAARPGPRAYGRWVVFSNGAMMWLDKGNAFYESPLGKSYEHIERAQSPISSAPVGSMSAKHRNVRTLHFLYLLGVLERYAVVNGETPHSDKGSDHALYALKDYVPDAGVFDAPYGLLENGVAWFDDDEQMVRNGDFLYVNEAIGLDPAGPFLQEKVVLLADRWGVSHPDIRWVLLGSGHIGQVHRHSPNATDPLGKTIYQLQCRQIRVQPQ